MKKIILVTVALVCGASVFAQGLAQSFGNLQQSTAKLFGKSTESVEISVPEGKDILPAVYQFAKKDFKPENPKVVKETASLEVGLGKMPDGSTIPAYNLEYKIYFKMGFGMQSQESSLLIWQEDGKTYIQTMSMVSYTVDKNLRHTNAGAANAVKSMNTLANQFKDTLEASLKDDEIYKSGAKGLFVDQKYIWTLPIDTLIKIAESDKSLYSNLYFLMRAFAEKSELWFTTKVENNGVVGSDFDMKLKVSSVEKSKEENYKYEVQAIVIRKKAVESNGTVVEMTTSDGTTVYFYSNNDALLDVNKGSEIQIKGKIAEVVIDKMHKFSSLKVTE